MKPLISTLLILCSLTAIARNNPSDNTRHIIILDGISSRVNVDATVNTPAGSFKTTYKYSTWGLSLGYRYSITKNVRIGINGTYFSKHFANNTAAVLLGTHIEVPFSITENLTIGPSINMSYVPIDDVTNGQFTPGVSVAIMYKINRMLAVNLEPGFRFYFQKNNGHEIPLQGGLRLLF